MKDYPLQVFKLSCLSLGNVVLRLPKVEPGSGRVRATNVNLTWIIEPVEAYLLSNFPQRNFFIDPDSIDGCAESPESFCDQALQIPYSLWDFMNFHDYENIYGDLTKSYKAVKNENDVESSSSGIELVFFPEKLPNKAFSPRNVLV